MQAVSLKRADGEIPIDDINSQRLRRSEQREDAMLAQSGTNKLLLGSKLLGNFMLTAFLIITDGRLDELLQLYVLKEHDKQTVATSYLLEEGQLAL